MGGPGDCGAGGDRGGQAIGDGSPKGVLRLGAPVFATRKRLYRVFISYIFVDVQVKVIPYGVLFLKIYIKMLMIT